MGKTMKARLATALVAALAAMPIAAGATDGYFTLGTGPVQNGLAGAGIALPQDSSIAASNPAGIVRVGNTWEFGAGLFQPYRRYTVAGAPSGVAGTFGLAPGTVKSDNNAFLLPHFSWSRQLDAKSAIGVAVYGNGGLNTTYPGTGPGTGTFFAGATGVNLAQLFVAPTYARALGAKAAAGVSAIVSYQAFRAGGLANFAPFVSDGTANNLTDRGADGSWGLGARLGVLYDASPRLTLGAAYQTVTTQQKFSKYSDLFAQQGAFNVPATATVGLAWKIARPSVVAFDIEHIWYGRIGAVANPFSNLGVGLATSNPSYLLGGANGPGFGWRDTTFYKLGYQTDASQHLTLRAGIAYGKQPVAPSEVLFNILAPGVTEWHYAIGATVKPSAKSELSLALVDVPNVEVSGPNPLEVPGAQRITIGMHQFQIEAGYARKY
jgi:long-chain fatty acid transport protein